MAVQSIMCACGSGLGSSLIVHMNCEDVVRDLGFDGITVDHTTISDINPNAADIFVVGGDLGSFLDGIPEEKKVVLDNILDKDELKAKLAEKLGA